MPVGANNPRAPADVSAGTTNKMNHLRRLACAIFGHSPELYEVIGIVACFTCGQRMRWHDGLDCYVVIQKETAAQPED